MTSVHCRIDSVTLHLSVSHIFNALSLSSLSSAESAGAVFASSLLYSSNVRVRVLNICVSSGDPLQCGYDGSLFIMASHLKIHRWDYFSVDSVVLSDRVDAWERSVGLTFSNVSAVQHTPVLRCRKISWTDGDPMHCAPLFDVAFSLIQEWSLLCDFHRLQHQLLGSATASNRTSSRCRSDSVSDLSSASPALNLSPFARRQSSFMVDVPSEQPAFRIECDSISIGSLSLSICKMMMMPEGAVFFTFGTVHVRAHVSSFSSNTDVVSPLVADQVVVGYRVLRSDCSKLRPSTYHIAIDVRKVSIHSKAFLPLIADSERFAAALSSFSTVPCIPAAVVDRLRNSWSCRGPTSSFDEFIYLHLLDARSNVLLRCSDSSSMFSATDRRQVLRDEWRTYAFYCTLYEYLTTKVTYCFPLLTVDDTVLLLNDVSVDPTGTCYFIAGSLRYMASLQRVEGGGFKFSLLYVDATPLKAVVMVTSTSSAFSLALDPDLCSPFVPVFGLISECVSSVFSRAHVDASPVSHSRTSANVARSVSVELLGFSTVNVLSCDVHADASVWHVSNLDLVALGMLRLKVKQASCRITGTLLEEADIVLGLTDVCCHVLEVQPMESFSSRVHVPAYPVLWRVQSVLLSGYVTTVEDAASPSSSPSSVSQKRTTVALTARLDPKLDVFLDDEAVSILSLLVGRFRVYAQRFRQDVVDRLPMPSADATSSSLSSSTWMRWKSARLKWTTMPVNLRLAWYNPTRFFPTRIWRPLLSIYDMPIDMKILHLEGNLEDFGSMLHTGIEHYAAHFRGIGWKYMLAMEAMCGLERIRRFVVVDVPYHLAHAQKRQLSALFDQLQHVILHSFTSASVTVVRCLCYIIYMCKYADYEVRLRRDGLIAFSGQAFDLSSSPMDAGRWAAFILRAWIRFLRHATERSEVFLSL
jgi:hypothetical protein